MDTDDHVMTNRLVELEVALANAFEMGKYHEVSSELDVAVWEKDVARTERVMKELLGRIGTLQDFSKSALYQHMTFKEPDSAFTTKLRESLKDGFSDRDAYGYMEGNAFWESLTER